MSIITYGKFSVDLNGLHSASLAALASRGLAHFLGNEQASKVVTKIEAVLAGETPESKKVFADLDKAARRSAINAWREANETQVAIWEDEVRQAAFLKIGSGEMGVSTRGPSVDPVESAMNAIAKREVTDTLKGAGLKFPKGASKDKAAETVVLGENAFTGEQLVARRLATHGDRIRKEAQKHVDELSRKAKKAQEAAKVAKAAGAKTAEDLGL